MYTSLRARFDIKFQTRSIPNIKLVRMYRIYALMWARVLFCCSTELYLLSFVLFVELMSRLKLFMFGDSIIFFCFFILNVGGRNCRCRPNKYLMDSSDSVYFSRGEKMLCQMGLRLPGKLESKNKCKYSEFFILFIIYFYILYLDFAVLPRLSLLLHVFNTVVSKI